jgi:hypothetical protein
MCSQQHVGSEQFSLSLSLARSAAVEGEQREVESHNSNNMFWKSPQQKNLKLKAREQPLLSRNASESLALMIKFHTNTAPAYSLISLYSNFPFAIDFPRKRERWVGRKSLTHLRPMTSRAMHLPFDVSLCDNAECYLAINESSPPLSMFAFYTSFALTHSTLDIKGNVRREREREARESMGENCKINTRDLPNVPPGEEAMS